MTGKNVVFDLNGKTITVDSLSTSYIMIVEANTTLELKDTAGNGKIVRTSPNNTEKTGSSIYLIQNQGNLTITSGTYEMNYNEDYINTIGNSGNLTVNGGTIIAKGNATTTAGISAYSGKVTINGGSINASISGEAYCAYGVYNTGVKNEHYL